MAAVADRLASSVDAGVEGSALTFSGAFSSSARAAPPKVNNPNAKIFIHLMLASSSAT